ncbi:MAG: DUF4062 domain-containing protein [Leptospirales bacterium]
MTDKKKLIIFISSTVYCNEELLNRIYGLLISYKYEVWCSHKGTIQTRSDKSNIENCLTAVEKADIFLGIIFPNYGTGKIDRDLSFTHQEFNRAIELNKPRWILAHENVVFARSLLTHLGYKTKKDRIKLKLEKNNIFTDLRLIDLYEDAIIHEKELAIRKGNWVQKYNTTEDGLLFANGQFSRYQEVEKFVEENLSDESAVKSAIRKPGKKP